MEFKTAWNLKSYFYESLNDPCIDVDIATWLPLTQDYAERYKGKIKHFSTPEEVLEYYEYGETMDLIGKKTMHYLSYLSALDTQDTEVQKKMGELEYLGIQLSELTLFVSQEWRELGADTIRAFADSPLLAAYRNDLLETANTVQYVLDEKVEFALNKKSRALGIFGLHEELRSSFLFPWEEGTSIQNTKDKIHNESNSITPPGESGGGGIVKIIFIRHGESETNVTGTITGDEHDVGFSEKGKQQIQHLNELLEGEKIDAIYSSPKKRCQETIHSISEKNNINITTDSRFTERIKGNMSGLNQNNPDIKSILEKARNDWSYRPMDTGESFGEVFDRAYQVLEEIWSKHTGQTVIICAHHPVIGVLVGYLTNGKFYYSENAVPTCLNVSKGSDGRLRGNINKRSAIEHGTLNIEHSETKFLTEEEIRAFAKNPNRDLRRKAAESMNSVYLVHQNQITLGNLYTGIVKNCCTSVELRGYKTVMSRRNISEQLPDKVVDTLMSEVQKYYPLYERFLRAKHKHLGVEKFHGYDVNAPLFQIEKKIPYEEACNTVINMFSEFDGRFGNYAKSMIEEERVDAFPKAGKRGGAFASYDKGMESFVLLNYTNTVNDIFTLAHELGHAIHGHLAQIQASCVYDAPLVLAETASIFSESLLMEKIQQTLSPEEKLELLNQKLLDVFGSIHRQIMYVSFERRVHEHILSGGELTYKELNLWWDEESKKLSGNVITPILPPEKNYTWSAIPHIFSTPFYCYAYSFGMLVSLALVEKYKREGSAMIEDYVRLLSSGGSIPPVEILQSIGIDVTQPEFYSEAFKTIEGWLEEFENTKDRIQSTK